MDDTLRRFLDRLASPDPTPGGGSASALAGAMAAALLAMVCRLSKAKDGSSPLQGSVSVLEQARGGLIDLVARDAQAFDEVMQAMRMPKGTDEERRTRQQAIQNALIGATAVPLAVASQSLTVLEITPEVARTGNANAVSDVGVGALLAHSAVQGALLNVRINLGGIKDDAFVTSADARAGELGTRADELRDESLRIVRERLR